MATKGKKIAYPKSSKVSARNGDPQLEENTAAIPGRAPGSTDSNPYRVPGPNKLR